MPITISARTVDPADLQRVARLAESLSQGSPVAVALHLLVSAAERGVDLSLLESDQELTPNQAAEILKMSRPHLVKLMDRGLLAYRMVGSNRRVRVEDLLDYIDRHERANAYVSHVVSTREHSLQQVKDDAATLNPDELKSLGLTPR